MAGLISDKMFMNQQYYLIPLPLTINITSLPSLSLSLQQDSQESFQLVEEMNPLSQRDNLQAPQESLFFPSGLKVVASSLSIAFSYFDITQQQHSPFLKRLKRKIKGKDQRDCIGIRLYLLGSNFTFFFITRWFRSNELSDSNVLDSQIYWFNGLGCLLTVVFCDVDMLS